MPEPLFTGYEFDVTLEDAEAARKRADETLKMVEDSLADPDTLPTLKRFAETQKESAESQVGFYKGRDDETVLGLAQAIFERGKTLEAEGLPDREVVAKIDKEIPEAVFLHGMLEYKPWGHMLNVRRLSLSLETGQSE